MAPDPGRQISRGAGHPARWIVALSMPLVMSLLMSLTALVAAFATAASAPSAPVEICEDDEAQRTAYPIKQDVEMHCDDIEKMWHNTFYAESRAGPEEHPAHLDTELDDPCDELPGVALVVGDLMRALALGFLGFVEGLMASSSNAIMMSITIGRLRSSFDRSLFFTYGLAIAYLGVGLAAAASMRAIAGAVSGALDSFQAAVALPAAPAAWAAGWTAQNFDSTDELNMRVGDTTGIGSAQWSACAMVTKLTLTWTPISLSRRLATQQRQEAAPRLEEVEDMEEVEEEEEAEERALEAQLDDQLSLEEPPQDKMLSTELKKRITEAGEDWQSRPGQRLTHRRRRPFCRKRGRAQIWLGAVVCVPRVPEYLQAQHRAAKFVLLEASDAAPTHAEQLRGVAPERIRQLVDDGAWKKLLAGLRGGAPLVDSADAEGDLGNLFLTERSWVSRPFVAATFDVSEGDFQAAAARELRESSPHAAAGRHGGRATRWQAGSGDERYVCLLARALKKWLDGEAPPELNEIFFRQTLHALRKSNGGIRPIAVGVFLRRLALRALLRRKRQGVRVAVGEMQFALGRAARTLLSRHEDRQLDSTQEPPTHLQRELTDAAMFATRADLLHQLPEEVHRGRLRQGDGPGAGSFLCAPQKGARAMADGTWRMALRKRLLCTTDKIISPATAETHCQHIGHRGARGALLGGIASLANAEGCKVGGGVVGGHNEVRDILLRFAAKCADPRALKEQRLQSLRAGKLEDADDVDSPGDALDGRRALPPVREKRRRHASLNATPRAFEIGGRAGESALATIRKLAAMAGSDAEAPVLAANPLQEISIALYSALAWRVASAFTRPDSIVLAGSR
ncbi:unnamed protein product [Prorocentrum cordatum]|uniref:H(+)-exporting diphosphatase n=1 Tax=Prorocentrum cordatum TaxID=2364126 RepID=A0ABN9V0X0_9DINO|nr:unnamed protein product [Polarella glacialis]